MALAHMNTKQTHTPVQLPKVGTYVYFKGNARSFIVTRHLGGKNIEVKIGMGPTGPILRPLHLERDEVTTSIATLGGIRTVGFRPGARQKAPA